MGMPKQYLYFIENSQLQSKAIAAKINKILS